MSAAPAAPLGAARVAEAEPDGYTLLVYHIGMATSATLYRKLPYDTLNAFEYVGLVTEVPMTIVGRKDFEPTDLKGLVEYAKANKDKVTLANAGIGAASHLCGMLFMSAIGTPLITVPYKGTGPAMTDLLGGQVDIMCDQTTNTTKQIQGGTIKAYAVTSPDAARRAARRSDRRGGRAAGHAGRHLARPLRAEGHAGRDHRAPVEIAAGGAQGSRRRRPLRRARHQARHRRRGHAGGAEGQARERDRALEADHRRRRPVRGLR